MTTQLREPTIQRRPCLLAPGCDQPTGIGYECWHRYRQAARHVDELCRDTSAPVRVLDVGANVVTLLAEMLDPHRVQVVRCDVIDGAAGDCDYIKIDADKRLPFDDGSFDVVVALEVLEHIPCKRRQAFIADLARVAAGGVVLSCPIASPAVVAAEAIVAAAYESRRGEPHPFLREHAEFGLPTEDEVTTILRRSGVPFAVYDGLSVDQWLAATLLSECVLEHSGSPRLQQEVSRAFAARPADPKAVPYRKMFVIGSTVAAGMANGVRRPHDLSVAVNSLAEVAGNVLALMDHQNGHLPAVLRSVIREQENGLQLQEQRFQITGAFADALTNSMGWRLLAPLRGLKHLLRPRGFDRSHLLPWQALTPASDEPHHWQALNDDPQFLVSCWLPAGWLRVRLRCHSSVKTRMEFFAERRGNFSTDTFLGDFSLVAGDNNEEFYLKLDHATRALRIDPLAAAGTIRFEQLEVTPRPGPYAIIDALRRKLRLLRAYRNTGAVLRRGLKLLCTGQWREVARKWSLGLHDPRCTRHGFYEPEKAYEQWIEKHALTDTDRAAQRDWAVEIADPPLISLVMPTYNTPERYLRLAVESVVRQTYPRWELCIADDGSTEPHVRAVLEEYAAAEPRIKLAPPGRHGGISAASNAALALAEGDFIALMDHDDELAEDALYRMACTTVDRPEADVLYSDEDKLQPDGKRIAPFFKPDWSPEFFLGCMYTCHLSLYRTELVQQVGGFRPEFDGAQDYDLALRVMERARQVAHVPHVLYHWRLLPNSTASGVAAKPHAHAAALRALEEHLQRTGRPGWAEVGPSAGLSHVRFTVQGTPTVSIIIPSLGKPDPAPDRVSGYLENGLDSIRRLSSWRHFEVIVLDRHTMPADLAARLQAKNVRRVTYDAPFNWSAVNNLGARHARGDVLLFLNDDIEVVTPGWLDAMLEFAQQKDIGAVGAKLCFPDGGLQHVGVTVLDGRPGHPFYGYPKHHSGYFCRNLLPHNCAAVTGACLMTRANVFAEVGGFDESFPLNYNDVDYCFRLRQRGYRCVYTPHAELIHFESVTKPGVFAEELRAFQARWGDRATDPYYNPNLNMETFDYRIG